MPILDSCHCLKTQSIWETANRNQSVPFKKIGQSDFYNSAALSAVVKTTTDTTVVFCLIETRK